MKFTGDEQLSMVKELKLLPHFWMPFNEGTVWELQVMADGLAVRGPETDAERKGLLGIWLLASRAALLGKPFSITWGDLKDFNHVFGKWAEDCPTDELITSLKRYFTGWRPSAYGTPDAIVSGSDEKISNYAIVGDGKSIVMEKS